MVFKKLPPPYIPSFIVRLNEYIREIIKRLNGAITVDKIKQTTGESTTDVMSQAAVTTALQDSGMTPEEVQAMIDTSIDEEINQALADIIGEEEE